ncbi:MAG: TIGR01244 family sulfur transferase [Notoacmeibacter sp.]
MDVRQIAADFSVAGQIDIEDIANLRGAGFQSIICNRPDFEDPNQTGADVLRSAILAAGLEHRFIPVSGSIGATPENVEATIAALEELPRPILAYCRSGARSTNLYQMAVMRGAKP